MTDKLLSRFSLLLMLAVMLAVAWGPLPVAAQPPGGVGGGVSATTIAPSFSNLDYVGAGNSRQMLDLWVPPGDGPFPIVLWIHGGAFRAGSKASPPPFPDRLMPRGLAFASLGYRLSSEATWPAQIQDVKAAVRFLRANAQRYRLDANRFGVVGASAGGHLAAMLGVTGETTIWDSPTMTNANVSSRVQAVIDQFGPVDFGQMDAMQVPSCPAGTTNTVTSPESQLLACTIGTCPEKVREASPLTYVSARTPPFLLAHGSNDCNISYEQSRLLAEALTRAGGRPIVRVVPGAGHGGPQFDQANYVALLDGFLIRHLKTATSGLADVAEFQSAVAAPGQVLSLFGTNLGGSAVTASGQPWPTALGGTSVSVRDAAGNTQAAGLIFVSPSQVNLQLPSALAAGPSRVSIVRNGVTIAEDTIDAVATAPNLFVRQVNGSIRPVGEVLSVDSTGVTRTAPLLTAANDGTLTPGRLTFSSTSGPLTVVLYGTGLNGANQTVTARVADVSANVTYAGPQGQFAGLDQFNIEIPRSLVGRGDVTLSTSVNGMPATAVRLSID